MKKKQVIKLNESQLRLIVSESVKRVLKEQKNSWLDTMDNLVSKWNEPYKKAKRLSNMVDNILYSDVADSDASQRKIRTLTDKYYNILKDIVEDVNSVVGDEFIQICCDDYMDYYYLDAYPAEYFDIANLFLHALTQNRTYSELYHNYQNEIEVQKNKEEAEQQKFVNYWNRQNVSAEPSSWTGGVKHTDGKYSDGIELPKVLGKIDLPKETPRITAKRNKALGK